MEARGLFKSFQRCSKDTKLRLNAYLKDFESNERESERQLFEEFSEWKRLSKGEGYENLDSELTEYLREKFFEKEARSFAVALVKAVKFFVPEEFRDSLPRARAVVAAWDSAPWIEADPEKIRAAKQQVLRSFALCEFLASNVFEVQKMRLLFRDMVKAVDHAMERIYGSPCFWSHILEDSRSFFEDQLTRNRHAALRLVIKNSPAYLQMEMCGSASWQKDGRISILGQELCDVNCDTVGLLYRSDGKVGIKLQEDNNLKASSMNGGREVLALGEKLRQFLDAKELADVTEILQPKTLSVVSQLFPDAKYDLAFLPETFELFDKTAVYAREETSWLYQARGSPSDCYVSTATGKRPDEMSHLLKTQKHLDSKRVDFYTSQLQEALSKGSASRPTALVFDFYTDGQIHDIQPNEDVTPGPGGRRLQYRRCDACDVKFAGKKMKTWFLLDGHHKVEAAARLGCSLNFLVISPCAEPYTPLEPDEFTSALTRQFSFPYLSPEKGVPHVRWDAAHFCKCSPMYLSSLHDPPERFQNLNGCGCFCSDSEFPRWAYPLLSYTTGRCSKAELLNRLRETFGNENEIFSTYLKSDMAEIPNRAEFQIELMNLQYSL